MKNNGREERSALLIRCSKQEAEVIREAAKHERRTVSSYVLNAVMSRMSLQQRLGTGLQKRKQGPIFPPTSSDLAT
jgi:hypothetical protein